MADCALRDLVSKAMCTAFSRVRDQSRYPFLRSEKDKGGEPGPAPAGNAPSIANQMNYRINLSISINYEQTYQLTLLLSYNHFLKRVQVEILIGQSLQLYRTDTSNGLDIVGIIIVAEA
jgi:hypothetical protein